MKKTCFLLSISLTFLLIGCGSSGENSSTKKNGIDRNSQQYEGDIVLWNYIVPSNDATNRYIKTNGTQSQQYQIYFAKENNRVTEISELSQNEKTVYTNNGNTIDITFYTDNAKNGSVTLKSKVNINDIVTVKKSDCRLKRHFDQFSYEDKIFADVIEIQCGNTPGYYQKGVGEIMQQKILSTKSIETKILTQ